MGVHGLTTYLRGNHAIARPLQFTSQYTDSTRATFVIDGWSFIYETLALLDLPWVYGGEYRQFSNAVQKIVKAWLGVGLRLYFVFDGPFPELKFPTIISRMTENNIKPSLLFFRTSSVSRSKPKFLRESTMLPPRAYAACIQTLRNLQHLLSKDDTLELHFADEEGDPYAVELAARLGGFVIGKDSDFVILNADGYQGYIPLDDMIWSSLSEKVESVNHDEWGDNDGFQTVVNSKSKRKAVAQQNFSVESGHGIIPPDNTSRDTLQLSVIVYCPVDLAAHLEIPLSLLPLLAALVGNDFTGQRPDVSSATTSQLTNLQWLFFERNWTLSERIVRVATTLRNILKAALTLPRKKNKNREKVSSVMELIDRAVTALIVRNIDSMASGEKERVVERVVEATLQYAIPKWEGEIGHLWASDVCALHEPGTCPLVLLRSPTQLETSDALSINSTTPSLSEYGALGDEQDKGRMLYTSAYRSGYIDPYTLDVLHSGTFWYRQFLENPDFEAVARTFSRPIQLWIYAVLDNTIGIPQRTGTLEEEEGDVRSAEGEKDSEDDCDDDELIDVAEDTDTEDDDPLAPLRGALQQLNNSVTAAKSAASGNDNPFSEKNDQHSSKHKPKKVVEEYIRRGTRLAAEDIEVQSLTELVASTSSSDPNQVHRLPRPLALQSTEERFSIILRAVGTAEEQLSYMEDALRELPSAQRVPLLTLRSILSRLHFRARESGGIKEREKERWTKQEAQAFLASFSWSCSKHQEQEEDQEVPIVDRSVQLTAQVLATTDAIERLSECLMLSNPDSVNEDFVLPSPALLFSGKTFHAYLTGTKPIPQQAVSALLWNAACKGLEDTFGERAGKRRKKDKDSSTNTGQATPVAQGQAARGGKKPATTVVGGKFRLLASLSVE